MSYNNAPSSFSLAFCYVHATPIASWAPAGSAPATDPSGWRSCGTPVATSRQVCMRGDGVFSLTRNAVHSFIICLVKRRNVKCRTENEKRRTRNGEQEMENTKWRTRNGKHRTDNEKWRTRNGEWETENEQWEMRKGKREIRHTNEDFFEAGWNFFEG